MKLEQNIDLIGDNHISTSSDTPMKEDAFELSNDEKINRIQLDVEHIMETLGLDLTDDSLSGTPKRVAKMFVNELFSGLDPKTNQKLQHSKTNTSTEKCWWRKISHYIQLVSIIFFLLLEEHMLLTFQMVQLLDYQK